MRKLLKEISAIPGVTGTCIFDKHEGAVCTEPDAELSRTLTENVGIHFVRLMQMGRMNKLDIKSAHFRFDRYAVIGLPLEKGAILLAVCDANANCSLVATTAAMLADDMLTDLGRPAVSPESPKALPEGKKAPPAAAGALEKEVAEIEGALAAAIGPIAGVVIGDYVARWRESGPAEASRLPELIDMLVEEIGDPALTAEFKAQLKHYL